MIRRMAVLLTAAMLMTGLGISAAAAQTGSIRVSMDYREGVTGGELALFHVAEPLEGGYRLGASYGGGFIRQEEACSPELAQWLAERIVSEGICKTLDEAGNAAFSDLEKGLYLLTQTSAPEGWLCAAPFLVPMPLDGEWEVLACPKQAVLLTQAPKTGQHPAPLFAAMGLVLSGTGLYLCFEKIRKK